MLSSRKKFLIYGFLIHVFYLLSVLHIYFRSPILKGVKSIPFDVTAPAAAKRLVLFVTDGLQADKAFNERYAKSVPFLRNIIRHKGIWGVSHTRVPTESRVGHVSLIAGTYEDVSAITNGWQDNPVDFDSTFNQSFMTWCWGSPDILHIFDKGDMRNIQSYSYEANKVDFAGKDPSTLDQWVFHEAEKFFEKSKLNVSLQLQLQQSKIIFFFHLLGIDTNGHAHKPDSPEYLRNIEVVDQGIRNISSLIESYYENDGLTSYIVTSDHGMTPWGAHGTGLPSETETPFIGWGAGLKQPTHHQNINIDKQSIIWGLRDIKRFDLNQVDIAPLMSFLIGVSYPVNSVGILHCEVLDVTEEEQAMGMLLNVKQILEQFYTYENKVKKSSFLFKKYPQFESSEALFADVIAMFNYKKDFHGVITQSKQIINNTLEGIQYYHQYNQVFFSIVANIGFIAWICFVLLEILYGSNLKTVQNTLDVYDLVIMVVIFVMVLAYWMKSADKIDLFYTFFPIMFSKLILRGKWTSLKELVVRDFRKIRWIVLINIVIVLAGVELIVFSFFQRGVLSIIGISIAFLPWYKLLNSSKCSKTEVVSSISWTIICCLSAVFPQLPVITREERYLWVLLASFVAATFGVMYSFFVKSRDGYVIAALTFGLVCCSVIKFHAVTSIKNGDGLPFFAQVMSWLCLILFPFLGLLTQKSSFTRLVSVSMALFTLYVMMSISYEAIFLLLLCIQLGLWITMEGTVFKNVSSQSNKTLVNIPTMNMDELRIAFTFMYFLFFSFFGTGNIASVNSFDIATTYCFQTVFNPLIQGLILALKVFIPIVLVTIFFQALRSVADINISRLFSVILLLTDIMALNFFFLIKTQGSWLDIGKSLSHFIITSSFIVLLLPVYEVTYYVSGRIEKKRKKYHFI